MITEFKLKTRQDMDGKLELQEFSDFAWVLDAKKRITPESAHENDHYRYIIKDVKTR